MKKILLICATILALSSCWVLWGDDRATSNAKLQAKLDAWESLKILALWDSLTAGYGVDIADSYPSKLEDVLSENEYNYEVINAGVSWDTSGDLLERAELYLEQDPDVVLVVIGGNDGLQSKSVEDMKKNIIDIIDLYDNGERKIVLWWMQIPINLGLSYSKEFKAAYKEISKEKKSVYFLKEFLEGVGWYSRYNLSDRIHPNPDGYDIIVANIFEFMQDEKILKK